MARLDTLFDGIIMKAKEIAVTAGEKTSEVVETGRLKYRQRQIATELEKTYVKLGAIVYEARQNGENFDSLIDKAMSDLTLLNKRFDQLDEAIALVGKQKPLTQDDFVFEPTVAAGAKGLEILKELDCVVCETNLEPPKIEVSLGENVMDIAINQLSDAEQESEVDGDLDVKPQQIVDETKKNRLNLK